MSLQTDGYLSPDVGRWIAKHRAEDPECFALAERLNRACQRAMLACSVPDNDKQALLVALLFARALSSFQGAILMTERGMSVEALTLARSCLETSFYLAAIARNPYLIEGLVGSDTKHKHKMAKWFTGDGAAAAGLSPDKVKALCEFLSRSSTNTAPSTSIAAMAAAADLSGIYETLYRDLCDRAAHPSLNSLLRHVRQDAQGNIIGLRFGPETEDTREMVLASMNALFPHRKG